MIDGFIWFDRIRSEAEFQELVELAKQDCHGVFIPTHPLRKNGKTVGYFSVGAPGAVYVWAWLSTKDIPARESFHLVNSVEDMVARGNGKVVCFPVPKDSPFHPLMVPMGYKSGGIYEFFIKEL